MKNTWHLVSILTFLFSFGFTTKNHAQDYGRQEFIQKQLPIRKYSNNAYRQEFFPVELFQEVKRPPVFFHDEPCASLKKAKRNFTRHIDRFIRKNINRKMLKEQGAFPSEEHVVNVTIRINKKGQLTHVIAEGFHPILEQEVNRVLWELPLMIPAENYGTPVNMAYNTFVKFKS